jgi:hypothetical protein
LSRRSSSRHLHAARTEEGKGRGGKKRNDEERRPGEKERRRAGEKEKRRREWVKRAGEGGIRRRQGMRGGEERKDGGHEKRCC